MQNTEQNVLDKKVPGITDDSKAEGIDSSSALEVNLCDKENGQVIMLYFS